MRLAGLYLQQKRRRQLPDVEPQRSIDIQPAAEKLGIKPEQVAHYAQALTRWAAAGFPTRTDAEVEACLAVCRECEHFTGTRCRACGCCVNRSKMAVFNKAKMKTEECFMGKWPRQPVTDVDIR